jgi:Lysine-specific metallo-endopeptidase
MLRVRPQSAMAARPIPGLSAVTGHALGRAPATSFARLARLRGSAATAIALELQRTVGNSTTRRVLQRQPSGQSEEPTACPIEHQRLIDETWARSLALVNDRLPLLEDAFFGKFDPAIARGLQRHFKVTVIPGVVARNVAAELLEGYKVVKRVLEDPKSKNYNCRDPNCEGDDIAHAWPMEPPQFDICPSFFAEPDAQRLAGTWVHEITHTKLKTADLEYYHYRSRTTLPIESALKNADCWGNFIADWA